jgi:toxin-antitoxin system PIN domain toxin
MLLFDVNIYVYAHREDSARHAEMRGHLENAFSGPEPVGYSPLALSGFVRVVTHPKVFAIPTELETALQFCRVIADQPGAVPVVPAESHWHIFAHLVRAALAAGVTRGGRSPVR